MACAIIIDRSVRCLQRWEGCREQTLSDDDVSQLHSRSRCYYQNIFVHFTQNRANEPLDEYLGDMLDKYKKINWNLF